MSNMAQELERRLHDLRSQGLYRELRRIDSAQGPCIHIDGKTLLNFSSNDYLGLTNEPALKAAAADVVERYGAGAGASRLICGSLAVHHELDETIATFKGAEAALSFSTGYATALGTICALVDKDDVIVIDKLVHASIVDAARLCGAKLRVFAHNDLNDLEDILRWSEHRAHGNGTKHRVLIVTESVFSMGGDHAPLREMVELKERFGAWLMVDEAHATGIYGEHRRGLAEALGVGDHIDVQMGTLGKALGAAGGYICGSRPLIDYLVNRARSFIFSTAPVPAAAAAATAGIKFVQSKQGAERCRTLWQNVHELLGVHAQIPANNQSAILPIMIGNEGQAIAAATKLRARGIFIPAIRYPTVARDAARLRLTLTAAHTSEDVKQLRAELAAQDLVPGERRVYSHEPAR